MRTFELDPNALDKDADHYEKACSNPKQNQRLFIDFITAKIEKVIVVNIYMYTTCIYIDVLYICV